MTRVVADIVFQGMLVRNQKGGRVIRTDTGVRSGRWAWRLPTVIAGGRATDVAADIGIRRD